MQPQTSLFFFFNDTATTEIYTLSLHDALPILGPYPGLAALQTVFRPRKRGADLGLAPGDDLARGPDPHRVSDRKSTRLNSSHSQISYAVFCLQKKNTTHSRSAACDTITEERCH